MNELSDFQFLKGFTLEGSVLISWKKASDGIREFVGIRIAEPDESINDLMDINSSESEVKYNILVPVHKLEILSKDEAITLIQENLHNKIWNWKESYDFAESINELFK